LRISCIGLSGIGLSGIGPGGVEARRGAYNRYMPLAPIADVLDDLRAGKFVILVDDEDRENEGDLVLPAQFVTPEAITFLLSEARGYLCLSMTEADCDRLELGPQANVNSSARGTPFTVSIDGHPKHGFSTGVSARERARTIKMAIDPSSVPGDFVRPGHINPLRSRDGGVLVRVGQTEGSLDLCRLAGLHPSALIIEIMRDDGEMARMPDLEVLAERLKIKICSVAQIVEHRLARETLVRRLEPLTGTPIRTPMGTFTLLAFQSAVDPLPHVALCAGGVGALGPDGRVIARPEPTLVRMHRRHLLGDVFHDLDSTPDGSSGASLHAAMRLIQDAGSGTVVYLRPEGLPESPALAKGLLGPTSASARLENQLQHVRRTFPGKELGATRLDGVAPAPGLDGRVSAGMRDFGVGVQVLRQLGLRQLQVISNHQRELPGLESFGLTIERFVHLP
jgi:3,4-dihydroxy 2-butanone 4-phosphate synthase / GTP cyclohydrolase II